MGSTQERDPLSIVLLQRQPHLFAAEALRAAAEKAWKVSFAGEAGSKHFVMKAGFRYLVKAGPHLLAIFGAEQPYLGDDAGQDLDWLPRPDQKQAWSAHRAWIAIDYVKPEDVELCYCVVARLVAELLDSNCAGVYIPGERVFAPNDAALYDELVLMASSRDHGVAS